MKTIRGSRELKTQIISEVNFEKNVIKVNVKMRDPASIARVMLGTNM